MNCRKIMDMVYGDLDPDINDHIPFFIRIRIYLHMLWCHDCAREIERFKLCKDILRNDFFPPSAAMEDKVMALVSAEENEAIEAEEEIETSIGLSMKGWVIAGIIMLISFVFIFFDLEFNKMIFTSEISYMIPIGVIIGAALTCYGALFISSHLKEFTRRFGL